MALRLAVACVLVALLAPSAAVAAPEAAPVEHALAETLNEVRRNHRLPLLRLSGALERSADVRAAKLMKLDVFGHLGGVPGAGRFRSAGEALALHGSWRPRPGRTVDRWLASPTHRFLLLHHGFRHVGAGLSRGLFHGRLTTIWVLHLGGG